MNLESQGESFPQVWTEELARTPLLHNPLFGGCGEGRLSLIDPVRIDGVLRATSGNWLSAYTEMDADRRLQFARDVANTRPH